MTESSRQDAFDLYARAVRSDGAVALATVIRGEPLGARLTLRASGERAGTLGNADLDALALAALHTALAEGVPRSVQNAPSPTGEVSLFVDVHLPPPRLIVVGAVHAASTLVELARIMGFRTFVIDPRSAFATVERFPTVDSLIVRWPVDALPDLQVDEGCALVFLSHDEKIDNPALAYALSTPARYVGALGSRRTHAARLESLRAMGLEEDALARIHAPIGLDLGGATPEEIALSILAEIVAVRNGRRPAPGAAR